MLAKSPETDETRGRLKDNAAFAVLGDQELDALLKASCRRRFSRSRPLFREGDEARSIYVLLDGGVKICAANKGPRPSVLHLVDVLEPFGIYDVVTGAPRTESAISLSSCDVVEIAGAQFLRVLGGNAQFAVRTLSAWGARFRNYAIWCARFNHCGAREKVAAYLVSDASRRDETGFRAAYPTRRDIASLLGITPETLSRELSYFRSKGWVHVGQNGSLTVDDGNSLKAMISAC